ncbi:MAG: cobalt ECF transporter T component CbiQ [Actinobacteria bacterium]|nr:cobalt ECF transporter T component CbiQ [Actinomycetota bacterium]
MQITTIDRIASGDTFFHRLDGRVKTVLLLVAIVVSTVINHWYLLAGIWLTALVLFHSLRLSWRLLIRRLYIPFGIAWLVFLDLAFTNGSHPLLGFSVGPVTLTAYREGLWLGFLIALRIMAAVTLGSVLTFSTPMIEILETLRLCKLPGFIVDLAAMMYRYVFVLEETARNMRRSQLSRMGASAGWLQQASDMGRVGGLVLTKSLDRSTMIYKAMLARGYDENSIGATYFTSPVPASERGLGIMTVFLLVSLLIFDIFF